MHDACKVCLSVSITFTSFSLQQYVYKWQRASFLITCCPQMLHGWCWWIAVWVLVKGGRGSGGAAPLSGSRGLSLGWAHLSSCGKVSSGASEKVHLGFGKGDVTQERLQDTTQTGRREGLGETGNLHFTCHCRNHSARRADRLHKLLNHTFLISVPPLPFILCRWCQRCKAEPYCNRLRQLEGACPASCRGSASFQ